MSTATQRNIGMMIKNGLDTLTLVLPLSVTSLTSLCFSFPIYEERREILVSSWDCYKDQIKPSKGFNTIFSIECTLHNC